MVLDGFLIPSNSLLNIVVLLNILAQPVDIDAASLA